MASFLKKLEENYELFETFDGMLDESYFAIQFKTAVVRLLMEANSRYISNCKGNDSNPCELKKIYLGKDKDGKCYLEIFGMDDRTKIIIIQNEANIKNYRDIIGRKISESEFVDIINFIEQKRIERANISKRFLKDNPDPVDLVKETGTEHTIRYVDYLNQEYYASISENATYVEPKNEIKPSEKIKNLDGKPYERQHDIIKYTMRRDYLREFKPFLIYNYTGLNARKKTDVYVYDRNGIVIAFAEPITGDSFSKILFFKIDDINDKELIKEMITEGLQSDADTIKKSGAIVRSSHRDERLFYGNLKYLFGEESDDAALSFKFNVDKAISAYENKKIRKA